MKINDVPYFKTKSYLKKSTGGIGKSNKMNKKQLQLVAGEYHKWVRDMRELRQSEFYTSFRMTPEIFDKVLLKIEHKLQTCDLYRKDTISPAERFAVTLR